MTVDLSRLPSGTAGWIALTDHALTLGDLSEVDYLELKGSLAFGARQDRKRSAVVLARPIIGMANRMPDVAQKHFGGFGVVLIGVEGQSVVGAEQVDGAVLRDAVEPYVGEDGPRWDFQFISHPRGLVLAVIIDPPQWGDRTHACRKEYTDSTSNLAVRDGDVLVRVPGKTRQATSHDLAQLEARRSKAPHSGAEMRVSYAGRFDRASRSNVRGVIEGLIESVADDLTDTVPSILPPTTYGAGLQRLLDQGVGRLDRRSPEAFYDQVERWREECHNALSQVTTEFLRHNLKHGTFEIENESDRYLENVRVRVTFPASVTVLMKADSEYCDHGGHFDPFQLLPKRPAKYGELKPYGYGLGDFATSRVGASTPIALRSPLEVERTTEGPLVTWHVGDLPPRARIKADEPFVVFTDESDREHHENATPDGHVAMLTRVGAAWQVTARGINHVFDGKLTLDCRQEPGAVLRWKRR